MLGFEDSGPFAYSYSRSGGVTNIGSYYGGCVACDSSGDIYSVGMCQPSGEPVPLFHVASYDVHGNLQWEIYPPAPQGDIPLNTRAATVVDGSLFVVATGVNTASHEMLIVYQISLDGRAIQTGTESDSYGDLIGSAIVVTNGEVCVFGYASPTSTTFTYLGPGNTTIGKYPINHLAGWQFEENNLSAPPTGTTLCKYINAPLNSGTTVSVRADYVYAALDEKGNIQIAANGTNASQSNVASGFADGILMSCAPQGIVPLTGPIQTKLETGNSYDAGDNIVGMQPIGASLYVGVKSYISGKWQFNVEKFNLSDVELYHCPGLAPALSGNCQPQAFAVSNSVIAISGNYAYPSTSSDYYATYSVSDTNGHLIEKWSWEQKLPWPGNYQVGINSLAIDNYGNLYGLYGMEAGEPNVYKFDYGPGSGLTAAVVWNLPIHAGPGNLWSSAQPSLSADYVDSNLVVDPFGNVVTCLTAQSSLTDGLGTVTVPQMWTIQLMNEAIAGSPNYEIANGALLTVPAENGLLKTSEYTNGGECVLVHGPTSEKLSLGTDGSFVYQPSSGESGVDQFSYEITKSSAANDSSTTSNVGVVNIYIEPTVSSITLPGRIVVGNAPVTVNSADTIPPAVILGETVPKGSPSVSVSLSTSSTSPAYYPYAISIEPSVSVPAQSKSASFSFTIPALTEGGSIIKVNATSSVLPPYVGATPITASTSSLLTLFPDILAGGVTVQKTVIGGSKKLTGTVTLLSKTIAPAVIELWTSDQPVLQLESYFLTVPAGSQTVSFTYDTSAVNSSTPVTITAQEYGASDQVKATIDVEPGTALNASFDSGGLRAWSRHTDWPFVPLIKLPMVWRGGREDFLETLAASRGESF